MESRVFISYSSRSAEALSVRDALQKSLKEAGYKVFVDRWDVKPGDVWRRKILLALAKCTAGVILFSNDTLKNGRHPWVLYESSVLSFRRELDPHFRLIPVVLEDVKPEDLKKARFFSPLALDELQVAEVGDPNQVAKRIQQALGLATHRAGQKTLLQTVAEQFRRKIDALPDGELKVAAEKLRARALTAWPRDHCLTGTAVALARLVLLEGAGGMSKALDTLLDSLGPEKSRDFLALVEPLWVQEERAGRLRVLVKRPILPRFVTLNSTCNFIFTAQMYVDRAYWPDMAKCPPVISVSSAGQGENLVAHVSNDIVQYYLDNPPNFPLKPKQVESYLARAKPVFFALLPNELLWPTDAELQQLNTLYPNAIFILHTGDTPCEPEALPPAIQPLPEVYGVEECEAHDMFITLYSQINEYEKKRSKSRRW